MYDSWKNPEVLAIISKIAGVDLVTAMDFEIAHVNISLKSEKQKVEELEAFIDRSLTEADEGIAGCTYISFHYIHLLQSTRVVNHSCPCVRDSERPTS